MRFGILALFTSLTVAGPAAGDFSEIDFSVFECTDGVAFQSILSQSAPRFEFTGPETFVFRKEREWCEFWDRVHADFQDPPPCDVSQVDFRHQAVVAAAVGDRSNTCFGVVIPCVDAPKGRGRLRARVVEITPGTGCGCGFALTSPIHAVVVDKPVGRVDFDQRLCEFQCQPLFEIQCQP